MRFYFCNRTQLLMRSGSWMINLRLESVEASAEVRKSISRTQHEWTWQYIYILCDSFVALYQAWKLSIFVDDPIAEYKVLSHIVLFCTSGDADNQRMITGYRVYTIFFHLLCMRCRYWCINVCHCLISGAESSGDIDILLTNPDYTSKTKGKVSVQRNKSYQYDSIDGVFVFFGIRWHTFIYVRGENPVPLISPFFSYRLICSIKLWRDWKSPGSSQIHYLMETLSTWYVCLALGSSFKVKNFYFLQINHMFILMQLFCNLHFDWLIFFVWGVQMSIKETEYFYCDVIIAKWCFSTK